MATVSNTKILMKLTTVIESDKKIQDFLSKMETHSLETFSHSLQVGVLTTAFLMANPTFCNQSSDMDKIITASLLHDVGKLNIPVEVLEKKEPLTEKEWEIIRKHPRLGEKALEEKGFGKDIRNLVLFHHSTSTHKKGYPPTYFFVRSNPEIMKYIEIVSLCDIYSAIVQPRKYKSPKTKEYALEEIRKENYDIEILVAFKDMVNKMGDIFIGNFMDMIRG